MVYKAIQMYYFSLFETLVFHKVTHCLCIEVGCKSKCNKPSTFDDHSFGVGYQCVLKAKRINSLFQLLGIEKNKLTTTIEHWTTNKPP